MTAYRILRGTGLALIGLAPLLCLPAAAQQPAAQQPAAPQPAAPAAVVTPLISPVVMVIDVDAIMHDSKAAKAIDSQIETQRQSYQKDLAKREGDLHATEQDLAKQQSVLAADAFQQRRKDFEQRVNDFQRDVAGKRRSLEQSFNEARLKVQGVLIEIISQIATERRANLVLPKSQVILVDKSMDLTEEALKRLDQKMPTVNVVIAKATPDPTPGAVGAVGAPAAVPAKAPAQATPKKN